MTLQGTRARLTIFIGEDDTWHHKPLYHEIVHRAHAAGLAGASVLRGIEGYGASSRIHTTRLLSLSEDLPVAIVIVDTDERIRAFLPQLDELISEGPRHHRPGRGDPLRRAHRRACPVSFPARRHRGRRRRAAALPGRPGRAGAARLGVPVGHLRGQRRRIARPRRADRRGQRRGRAGQPHRAAGYRRLRGLDHLLHVRLRNRPAAGTTRHASTPSSTPSPASSPDWAPRSSASPWPRRSGRDRHCRGRHPPRMRRLARVH